MSSRKSFNHSNNPLRMKPFTSLSTPHSISYTCHHQSSLVSIWIGWIEEHGMSKKERKFFNNTNCIKAWPQFPQIEKVSSRPLVWVFLSERSSMHITGFDGQILYSYNIIPVESDFKWHTEMKWTKVIYSSHLFWVRREQNINVNDFR